jgi:hypothetical protein
MQPHVSIALNMFMPSTIDSEVGDDEEGGVSMRARRIGLDPNPRARLGNVLKNRDEKNRDDYSNADKTGSSSRSSPAATSVLDKSIPLMQSPVSQCWITAG